MDPLLGTITLFAGNFAPRGWALCNGQQLSIAQNTALFSILGTTYGGDGRTTFALPDLRGRVPLGSGQGTGLAPYTLGEAAGAENVTLLSSQMPAHNHLVGVNNGTANLTTASGNVLATGSGTFGTDSVTVNMYTASAANAVMGPTTISAAGGSLPHSNMQPFLCMNYIIALEGIFPSRN